MPNHPATNYPFHAETVGKVVLKPDSIPLPDKHPLWIVAEPGDFGSVETALNNQPLSGFLLKGEYRPLGIGAP